MTDAAVVRMPPARHLADGTGPYTVAELTIPEQQRPSEHNVSDNDIGRLSAEAVQQQYERAAKSVEDMGLEVTDRIVKLKGSLAECDHDLKLIEEAAAAIREKGALVHMQIQEAADLSKRIRDTCNEFKARLSETGIRGNGVDGQNPDRA